MNIHDMVIEKVAKEMQLALDQAVFQSFFNNEPMKLVWEQNAGEPRTLYARMAYEHGAVTMTGMTEEHIVPVQRWCEENNCGKRISYDMFRFRNEKEMSMFLLKWN